MSSGTAGGKTSKKTKAVAHHSNDDSNYEVSTIPQVPKKKAPVSKKRSRAASAPPAEDDDDENVASMPTAPQKKRTALAPKNKKRATAATTAQYPSEAEEASEHSSTPHSPRVQVEDTDLDYANGEDDDSFGALEFRSRNDMVSLKRSMNECSHQCPATLPEHTSFDATKLSGLVDMSNVVS